jgi:heme/copper-type cytochrome/quinol oxidase subunit 2
VSRARIAIVAAVVIVFAVGGGILINANRSHGGANRTIDVTVTAAKSMTPSNLTANQNDTVTINITSDTTGEVHLHGYDIAFNCTAGRVTSHTFKADKTGTFPIEWESTSTTLGTLVVT